MFRFILPLLAASLTIIAGCKRQSSDGAAGSGATGTMGSTTGSAMAGSAAGGSAAAAGSAMTGSGSDPATGAGSAAGGSAAAGAATGSDGGSAAMPGSGAGAAAEGMAHRAGMCPSTVLGATTTSAVKGKAVTVTITSTDKDAIAAIQKRTDKLLAEKKDGTSAGTAHDQKGTHGGGQGLCPVYVPDGATATAKHQAKGVVVTITPKDKPDELAKEIDGRITKAADWVKANVKPGDQGNQGGVGGGKGKDGSNHSGKGDGKGHDRKPGGGGGKGTGGGKGAGAGDKSG